MRTPPWLMAGALLFWGWQTGLLIFAAPLAVALEFSRYTRARWEMSDKDLCRVVDLCVALFVGAFLLLYSMEDRMLFIFKLAQWLPFCLYPIMLAQAYGNRPTMPLSVFWWLLRRSPDSPTARKSYNISYCFFACCILAGSASTQPNAFFYPGVALLVALALSSKRPRRISLSAWVTLLLLVATAGQFSHRELRQAQNAVEIALGGWIAGLLGTQQDAREIQTRIGYPGQIPQSSRIVMRLYTEPGGYAPPLLREATWDAYRKETWSASNNDFSTANPGSSEKIKLLPTNRLSSQLEIARYYDGGSGLLALPHGTFEIHDVEAGDVLTNRLGVTKVEKGLGLMIIRADYGPGKSFDAPPCARDLVVPDLERDALDKIVKQLKLDGMNNRQKIRAIYGYFANNFTYSLNAPHNRLNSQTWLGYFLQTSHKGHCEYFATATVLLLREAGVPARYVTGWVVPESAHHGDTYLVRERDSHAWALAYHGDTKVWEQVDTTPGDWAKADAQQSWWQPAYDAMSNLYFEFSKWRWSKTSFARYTSWLLVPLILYLIGRIALNQRRQQSRSGADGGQRTAWPGSDSELYLINRQLAAAQLSRLPNEPLQSWQCRLELAFPDSVRLRRIFHLHRALRFDPDGLKPDDRESLRSEAQRWMADFTARQAAQKQEQR